MKKLLLLSGFLFTNLTYANNVIYKCTSSTGEITYQNNMGNKSECTKTNFASFPNINIFKADSIKKTASNSGTQGTKLHSTTANLEKENNNNVSNEQKLRDTKRSLILTQELNQEKEQLHTLSIMLKNLKDTNSKDSTQIAQLEELKNSHINNITAIERELGKSKTLVNAPELQIEKAILEPNINNSSMMVTKALTAPSMLPTALPNTINSSIDNIKNTVIAKETKTIQFNSLNNNIKNNSYEDVKIKQSKIITTPVVSSMNTAKVSNEEFRRKNNLGKTMSYSSGLSGMTKVKK